MRREENEVFIYVSVCPPTNSKTKGFLFVSVYSYYVDSIPSDMPNYNCQ